MAVNATNGVWGQASEINAPPNASNSQTSYRANLELLACPAFGACAALGQYDDNSQNVHLMAAVATTAPTVRTSLAGSAILTRKGGWADVRLSCAGTATCTGTVKLTAMKHRKRGHSGKAKVIVASTFAIAPKTSATIKLELDATGHALLKAAHGHLRATLITLETSPAPSHTKTQSVRLTQRR